MGRLIVISGPSGVGKTSIVEGVREKFPFEFSVSATTRPARTGEEDGVDYFFVDEAEFDLMVEAGDFLEWAFYNDRRYGTLRSQVIDTLEAGNDVVLDIEVQGAAQVRERHPGALMIFIEPPSLEILEERLRARGDTDSEEVARRLAIAEREMAAASGLFDHSVVNDDLTTAIAVVVGILDRSKETDPHDD